MEPFDVILATFTSKMYLFLPQGCYEAKLPNPQMVSVTSG